MDTRVRTANSADQLAIEVLIRSALRTMPVLWNWEEHLEGDSFIVAETAGELFGALFAWADDSPVAWVRLAALNGEMGIGQWLEFVLPGVMGSLRRRGVQRLAWMDYHNWAGPYLAARGFTPMTDVITLVKNDRELPCLSAATIDVHPAQERHIPALMAVDRAAFEPYWWNSEATYRRRITTSSLFVVAEQNGNVVGFADGDMHWPWAHLNRLAVHPACQAHGIGTMLLTHMNRALWRAGATQITLNTQVDNHGSMRLYGRFGFGPAGDRVTVWDLGLT